jgi:hypothetical protein
MGRPNAFDGMMHQFCAKLGWCGAMRDGKPLHVSDFVPETGPVTADEFARWLVMADGLNPDQLSRSQLGELAEVFVKHMGASIVDASELRSGLRTP